MKIQGHWLPTLFLMLGSVAQLSLGQSADIKVKVPFAFNVAQAQLPAGAYVLSSASGKIAIRDSQGKTVAMALANKADRERADKAARAIFECYGDRCFLSQFWSAGGNEGARLVRSSVEIKIAAKQTGQYFAVMASPAQQ